MGTSSSTSGEALFWSTLRVSESSPHFTMMVMWLYLTLFAAYANAASIGLGQGLNVGPVGIGASSGLGNGNIGLSAGLGWGQYSNYGTPQHYQQYYSQPFNRNGPVHAVSRQRRHLGLGLGFQVGPVGFGVSSGIGKHGVGFNTNAGYGQDYLSYGSPQHYSQYYTTVPSYKLASDVAQTRKRRSTNLKLAGGALAAGAGLAFLKSYHQRPVQQPQYYPQKYYPEPYYHQQYYSQQPQNKYSPDKVES